MFVGRRIGGDMLNIDVLLSYKNYVIIKDIISGYVWLYSYNKPIAYYDKFKIHILNDFCTTNTNKKHKTIFEKWVEENL